MSAVWDVSGRLSGIVLPNFASPICTVPSFEPGSDACSCTTRPTPSTPATTRTREPASVPRLARSAVSCCWIAVRRAPVAPAAASARARSTETTYSVNGTWLITR